LRGGEEGGGNEESRFFLELVFSSSSSFALTLHSPHTTHFIHGTSITTKEGKKHIIKNLRLLSKRQ
jgi:hypothetical protein